MKTKKFIAAFILTLMMVVMMTGCGGKAKATVQFDHYPGGVKEIELEEIEVEEIEVEEITLEGGEQNSKFEGRRKILPW
jgi:hypothetical protein